MIIVNRLVPYHVVAEPKVVGLGKDFGSIVGHEFDEDGNKTAPIVTFEPFPILVPSATSLQLEIEGRLYCVPLPFNTARLAESLHLPLWLINEIVAQHPALVGSGSRGFVRMLASDEEAVAVSPDPLARSPLRLDVMPGEDEDIQRVIDLLTDPGDNPLP